MSREGEVQGVSCEPANRTDYIRPSYLQQTKALFDQHLHFIVWSSPAFRQSPWLLRHPIIIDRWKTVRSFDPFCYRVLEVSFRQGKAQSRPRQSSSWLGVRNMHLTHLFWMCWVESTRAVCRLILTDTSWFSGIDKSALSVFWSYCPRSRLFNDKYHRRSNAVNTVSTYP